MVRQFFSPAFSVQACWLSNFFFFKSVFFRPGYPKMNKQVIKEIDREASPPGRWCVEA